MTPTDIDEAVPLSCGTLNGMVGSVAVFITGRTPRPANQRRSAGSHILFGSAPRKAPCVTGALTIVFRDIRRRPAQRPRGPEADSAAARHRKYASYYGAHFQPMPLINAILPSAGAKNASGAKDLPFLQSGNTVSHGAICGGAGAFLAPGLNTHSVRGETDAAILIPENRNSQEVSE